MLISKRTYCFNCKKPSWEDGFFKYGFKTDVCLNCDYRKHTTVEGFIEYVNNNGESVNFLTSDPRFKSKYISQKEKS